MAVLDKIAGSRGDDFVWWSARNCTQSIDVFDGDPLVLEDWQREIFREALTETEGGSLYWLSVVVVLPRKNGKTTMLSAYGLYALTEYGGQPEILFAASSDKQAGRLFDYATSFVRRNARFTAQLAVRDTWGEIERRDAGGKALRMSSSPERLHGYNPSLVIPDELAQWTRPTLRKAWAALTTGGGARRRTQVFAISTAGEAHERQEGILGRLIDRNEKVGEVERPHGGLTISRNHEARVIVFNYSAPTEDRYDIDALKLANPASWITTEYLARQAANPELSDAEVLQLHGCVWAASEEQWIRRDAWDALERPFERLQAGDQIALGFDGSQYHDATALVACRVSDGLLVPLGIWAPDGHVDWEVPRNQVQIAVDHAFSTFEVVAMAADPPDWRAEIDLWQRTWGERVYGFATNKVGLMAPAIDRLKTAIVTGRDVLHTGERRLTEHVLNARTKETPSGDILKKERKDSQHKIDAAVAAVLAFEARATVRRTERKPGVLMTF